MNKKKIEKFFEKLIDHESVINRSQITIRDINHRKPNSIEVSVRKMYESPIVVNFALLKKISEFFGTDSIDVDDYSMGGCETCDYGSSYGHDFQIYGATKNI